MTRRQAEPFTTDDERRVYVTPAYYELTYGRNQRTVRDWTRTKPGEERPAVRSMWSGDVFYVHMDDCRKMDAKAAKQDRRTKEEAS